MPLYIHKELNKQVDEISHTLDQANHPPSIDDPAAFNFVRANQLLPSQLTLLSTKITCLVSRLESLNAMLKNQNSNAEPRSADIIRESSPDNRILLADKKSIDPKPAKKRQTKILITTHIEVKKVFLSSVLEIINGVHFKLDHLVFRTLALNSFDFLPYISQRLASSIPSHKDVNFELLSFCWKLMSFPKSNITFSDNQRLVGVPEVLPFRYGSEGPLLKNAGKPASKKSFPLHKGAFSFHEDTVHTEVVRLVRKIYNSSTKQLQMLATATAREQTLDDPLPTQPNVKEMYKEYKHTLNTKLHMYKVNFISFLMLLHLENNKFEMQMLRAREIKSDYFDRPLQQTHIKHWEAKVLSCV